MKKTQTTVLSSLVLSGAVLFMAPQSWSQTSGSSGAGSSSQKSSSDATGTGSSSRGTGASGSSASSGSSGSSTDMQSSRESTGGAASSRRASAGQRLSKDKVKEVQSALKSKGMDPGPEDGVLGPKTQQAIRELTPEHQAVILLREVEGLSYAEISEVLDCPKGTVMSRLHYARRQLQARLREML